MAAANTDKAKKLSRRWVGQIGAGGVADASTTTVPLASTTNLPSDTAVVVIIDRVDANGVATPSLEETIIGVVSGSNLANCVRGAEGTAQAHNAGAVVEVLVTAKGWNDIVDLLLLQHLQSGAHGSITATSVNYAADAGSNDTYAITLSPAPASYTTGQEFTFKANTANTGAATLNVNSLGAKTIKKLHDQDLADNDIESGQIVTVVYDGTNFQMQSQIANEATSTGPGTDGWVSESHTWTYASASTFTIAGVDLTAVFTKGTRLKFTQTTAKYAVVVASSFSTDTTVTIAVNTDYTIANAAITSPYYSYEVNPQGYPTYFNFTPSWTALSVGDGTNTGKFRILGRTIEVNTKLTWGSTTSISGNPNFTPVQTPTVSGSELGTGYYEQVGTGRFVGFTVYSSSAIYPLTNAGALLTSTVPFTWATTHILSTNLSYQF